MDDHNQAIGRGPQSLIPPAPFPYYPNRCDYSLGAIRSPGSPGFRCLPGNASAGEPNPANFRSRAVSAQHQQRIEDCGSARLLIQRLRFRFDHDERQRRADETIEPRYHRADQRDLAWVGWGGRREGQRQPRGGGADDWATDVRRKAFAGPMQVQWENSRDLVAPKAELGHREQARDEDAGLDVDE